MYHAGEHVYEPVMPFSQYLPAKPVKAPELKPCSLTDNEITNILYKLDRNDILSEGEHARRNYLLAVLHSRMTAEPVPPSYTVTVSLDNTNLGPHFNVCYLKDGEPTYRKFYSAQHIAAAAQPMTFDVWDWSKHGNAPVNPIIIL